MHRAELSYARDVRRPHRAQSSCEGHAIKRVQLRSLLSRGKLVLGHQLQGRPSCHLKRLLCAYASDRREKIEELALFGGSILADFGDARPAAWRRRSQFNYQQDLSAG